MASVKYISRMPEERRLAILTAFVKAQEISALDEAVDVLDMLILNITREAKTGQKKRLRTLKDLDRAALLLARACALYLMKIPPMICCERPYSAVCLSPDWQSPWKK